MWTPGPGKQSASRPARVRTRIPILLVVTASMLVACGGAPSSGSTTSQPSPTTRPTSTTQSTASGCPTSDHTGTTTLQLDIGPVRRTVIVHVPPAYSPPHPLPLVLNLHGSGSNAVEQEALTGMDQTADQDSFIVAYPQAVIPSGAGFDWNVPGVPLVGGKSVPAGAANDVSFLTRLVPVLESRYCIDSQEVYATGFSGGGRMASQLACDASDTVAAVAPVAGMRYPTPCPASRGVPIIGFHGTADPVDPFGGNGQAYWTYSVPTAAADWAAHNRCETSGATSQGAGFDLTTYTGCSQNAAVELYAIVGEGHEWPGGPPLRRSTVRRLGPQSDAVNANQVMWAFFVQHPLP